MNGTWLTPLLAPLLAYQGRQVRNRVPLLPEPPGPRGGAAGEGAGLRVLIVGDSSAAGVGASSQDDALSGRVSEALSRHRALRWVLLARTGATTASSIRALRRHPEDQFDVAVTVLGVNDVTSRIASKTWLARQAELRRLLRERFRVEHLVVCGLPPVSRFPALPQPLRWYLGRRARRFSELLERDVRADDNAVFLRIDQERDVSLMAPDGFHPGPELYRRWGEGLAQVILDLQDHRIPGGV